MKAASKSDQYSETSFERREKDEEETIIKNTNEPAAGTHAHGARTVRRARYRCTVVMATLSFSDTNSVTCGCELNAFILKNPNSQIRELQMTAGFITDRSV